jgi:hypothetical protein
MLAVLWLAAVLFVKILLVQEWLLLQPGRLRLVFDVKVHRIISIQFVNKRIVNVTVNMYQRKPLVLYFI